MYMNELSLVKCESYSYDDVYSAVQEGIRLIGGMARFSPGPNKSVLLKPNMLAAEPPGSCATTHPAVFRAVAQLLGETGTAVYYGDSGEDPEEETIRKTGMADAASQSDASHVSFAHGHTRAYPSGVQYRSFFCADALRQHNALISIPKFKTHALTFMTCCVKNQYGCIPGTKKRDLHFRIPDPVNFARYLLDLTTCIAPRLYVVDAIWAMEGNGPRKGTPKKLGCIAVGTDPVAIDATLCRIAAIDPGKVPSVYLGPAFNAGVWEKDRISVKGTAPDAFKDSALQLVSTPDMLIRAKGLFRIVYPLFAPRPAIDASKCVRCFKCIDVCPAHPKALRTPHKGRHAPPAFHYQNCIRCFCCQEFCPYGAIYVKNPVLYRLFVVLRRIHSRLCRMSA